MTIVLSNNLTCKQRELIVNTLFEVQEGMPLVANYYEPLYSLLANRVDDIKVPVKAIGDDLMTANENFSKKIRAFAETNGEFLDSILLNKISSKISKSNSSINVIEEYTLKFLKQASDYESLYSIGEFTAEEKQYLKEITLSNLSNYDLLKIELELFFEKITSTEIVLKAKESKPEEKAVVVITEEQIKAALNVDKKEEVKEEVKEAKGEVFEVDGPSPFEDGFREQALRVNARAYYENLARQHIEEAIRPNWPPTQAA